MAVIAPTPSIAADKSAIPERTLLTGLALTSFAALLLELALTRLFSVVLFYHFAFLAISIALLGLGAGGVLAPACGGSTLRTVELMSGATRIMITRSTRNTSVSGVTLISVNC